MAQKHRLSISTRLERESTEYSTKLLAGDLMQLYSKFMEMSSANILKLSKISPVFRTLFSC